MKVDLLKGDVPLVDEIEERVYENGAFVRVSFDEKNCFMEILKTFKKKEPELLSTLLFDFQTVQKDTSMIFETDYLRIELKSISMGDFFAQHGNLEALLGEQDENICVINKDRVVNISGDRRILKLMVVDMVNGQAVIGEIKLLKSLKFQQGKSVQSGKYSDAYLTRAIGIPTATLSRWKSDNGWRKNVYDLINKMDLPLNEN